MKTNKILKPYFQSNWDDLTIEVVTKLGDVALELIINHLKNDEAIPQSLLKNKQFTEYLEALKTLHSLDITIYD